MQHDHHWLRLWISALLVTLLLASSSVAAAFDVPAHRGAVTDTAGVLTAADDEHLEQRIARYEARTGNELGVLVVPSLRGETIEDVAYQTFNRWGVGKKGADNGVLLVIAVAEHRMRIETGKGIGDKLTDLGTGRILRERLAPKLRIGAFREGIDVTLDAIEAELDGTQSSMTPAPSHSQHSHAPHPSKAGTRTSTAEQHASRTSSTSSTIVFVLLGGVAVLGVALLLRRSRRRSHASDGTPASWAHTSASSFSSSFSRRAWSTFMPPYSRRQR